MTERQCRIRPVFTGLGVAAPTGFRTEAHWSAVLDGKSGIDHISRFDASGYKVRLAGEVRDFDAADHVPSRLLRETDLMTHLALAATDEALADAGIDPQQWNDLELSVVTANSSGGAEFGQSELQKLYAEGPPAVGAYMSIAWFYAATTGQMSIRHGMRGPCGVIATEQAGGLDALGHSRRALAKGAKAVAVGGSDASMTPYGLVAQYANGLLSECDDPQRAYLPFDARATGYVPGEGGAIMIVEDGESARARGADRIYGELAGYAATFDPRPGSGREPNLRRAAELALADAGIHPAEVDVVFADGYGVPRLDREEADALACLFGPYGVPVTVPKTMCGRLYAGGAALDVVTALLSIRDNVIPPTVNVGELAPGIALDLVREPREIDVRTALVLARGHGGFNAAVAITAAG
jgi:act minimal PKS chain-length factor (CLF/KS beta)